MTSESTPNKAKKTKRTEEKEELDKVIGGIKAAMSGKKIDEMLRLIQETQDKKLIKSKEDATKLLKLNVTLMINQTQDEDQRQMLIVFDGVLKEKLGMYDEVLQCLCEIGERNNSAIEVILSIVQNNYGKLNSDKSLEVFLGKNEKSSQSNILLLRAMYAVQKIYSGPRKTIMSFMASDKKQAQSNWPHLLKSALILLKRIPDKFVRLLDIKIMGSKKVMGVMDHQKIVEIILSVFDKAQPDSVDSLLEFLNRFKNSGLYEKKSLDDQVIAVIETFLECDKNNQLNVFLVEMYEKNGRLDEAQELRRKLQSNPDYEKSHQAFSDEKEDEGIVFEKSDVEFQKTAVKRLKEEALLRNEESMQRLLEYSKDAKFPALAEVWEAVGEIYVAIGAYKKAGKSAFEYPKKNAPEKCFEEAREAYEKCYKKKPRPGIYYDLAIKYREGRLFRKNTFLARRFLEEGRKNNDLNTDGLILLASMYFWGEGGIEQYDEAKKILAALNDANHLEDKPEALYILAECEYLFYLNAKVDGEDEKAEVHKQSACALFQKSTTLGHTSAGFCLELFLEKQGSGLVPMDSGADEEEPRDVTETGVEDEDPHEIQKVLTELCEALRVNENNEQHPDVVSLKARLVGLESSYQNCTPKNLFELLRADETGQRTYFDKDISDDSDSDRDEEYHGNDHAITAKKRDANKLIDKLRKQTQEFLVVLEKGEEEKLEKDYEDHAGKFRSKYTPILKAIEVNKNPSIEARRDLETVVDYAARGKLSEALAQISTPFYVVQTRGLHFFVDKWLRSQRHAFKKNIYDKAHPLLNQPIYSAAVHELAEVKERFPANELLRLKLQQAARCLSYRLRKLKDVSPHPPESLPAKLKSKSIVDREYRNRLMQVQQLYSGKYDAFLEEYLAWEIKQTPHFFANQEMHFVSTADIQSKHSAEYAMGNKYYPSKKDLRLRPRYNRELRAIKPHVGALFLTVQPLEDYLPERHNHIPSLNTQGEIELSELIVAERECTFFGSIPQGRLSHIEAMRFPSFHHEGYLEIMRHRYGLDRELYDRFKNLLAESKPHTAKNRLTILLLGEHISAYKTLALQKRADDLVRERGSSEYLKKVDKAAGVLPEMKEEGSDRPYLLYRTPMGNFSFFADQPYAASQKGDNVFLRSRRLQTAYHKKLAREGNQKTSKSQTQRQSRFFSQESGLSFSQGSHVVPTLGDGNCAFNAVTLGVCELLELGLVPENDFFDVVLATQLGLAETTREALVREVKKYKNSELRQKRFQPAIREVAIQYIVDHYDVTYGGEYREHLVNAYNDFIKPEDPEEDEIFCVHEFIKTKFKEETLSSDALEVWWEQAGKQQYFAELRLSARYTMDRARWGSEIEIDAFAKFLGIRISWESQLSNRKIHIGIEDNKAEVLFSVYQSGVHWSYMRSSRPVPVINLADKQEDPGTRVASEADDERRPDEDYDGMRKSPVGLSK